MKILSIAFIGTTTGLLALVFGIKFLVLDERDELKTLSELHSEQKVFSEYGGSFIPSTITSKIKLLDVLSSKAGDSHSNVVNCGLQVSVDPTYPVSATSTNRCRFTLQFKDVDGFTLHETSIDETDMTPVVNSDGIISSLLYTDTIPIPFNRAVKIGGVTIGYNISTNRQKQYKELENETPPEIHKRLEREKKERAEREERERIERLEKEEADRITRGYKEAREKTLREEREAAEPKKKEEESRKARLTQQKELEERAKQKAIAEKEAMEARLEQKKAEELAMIAEREAVQTLKRKWRSIKTKGSHRPEDVIKILGEPRGPTRSDQWFYDYKFFYSPNGKRDEPIIIKGYLNFTYFLFIGKGVSYVSEPNFSLAY